MSKQYNRNINGIPNVVCGEPYTDSRLKIQNFERDNENNLITFTSKGSGTGIDEWGFKLPTYDPNYNIKQIVFEIHGSNNDDIFECMFAPVTVKGGSPWFQYQLEDIDLLPSVQLQNGNTHLKLICGYFEEEKAVMIRVRAKKPTGTWIAKEYTLKGYYLLERQ